MPRSGANLLFLLLEETLASTNFARRLFSRTQLSRRRRNHPRHHVVIVGLGDFGAIETARLQLLEAAEVVDVHFAVDLRRMVFGAALPQQRRLLALALRQQRHLAAHPPLLGRARD